MKKAKKTILWVMVLVMFAMACLGGCGKSAPGEPEKTSESEEKVIKIACWSMSTELQSSANEYYKQTGIKVEIENYYSFLDDDNGRERYASVLSVELMSGIGADIFMLLGSGTEYREGLLYDFSDIIGEDEVLNDETLNLDLIYGTGYNGPVYALSAETMVSVYSASEKEYVELMNAHDSWESFFAQFDGQEMEKGVLNLDETNLFAYWLQLNLGQFVNIEDRTENLDSPKLKEMADNCVEWANRGYIPRSNMTDSQRMEFFQNGVLFAHIVVGAHNPTFFAPDQEVFQENVSQEKRYEAIDPESNGNIVISNTNYYGVSANSKMRPEAIDFLKFVLSDVEQLRIIDSNGAEELFGIKINRAAYKECMNKANKSLGRGGSYEYDEQALLTNAVEWTDNRSFVAVPSEEFFRLVYLPCTRYMLGEISWAEALLEMKNTIDIKLKELP